MSTTRSLSEAEARWLLPRIRSTRRALRVGWMVARLVFWSGALVLIGLALVGFADGDGDKSIVILPVGLFMGIMGFFLPTGKSDDSEDEEAEPVVDTWQGEVRMVRVPAGKTHTYVPTLDGTRPLMLPPGWGDEFTAGETVEMEAVEASTPGLHTHFGSALFVVSLRGRRSLQAELDAGLADAAPGLLVTWLVAGILGAVVVLAIPPLRLSYSPAYELSDIPLLLKDPPVVRAETWEDLQAADPGTGREVQLGRHAILSWTESERGGLFGRSFDGSLIGLPGRAGEEAFLARIDTLRRRMEAVRALHAADPSDTAGALHRRLEVLAGNPAWDVFEARRLELLRSWGKDPREAAWNLGWLRSGLFEEPEADSSFLKHENALGDSLWGRALLVGLGLSVSSQDGTFFDFATDRRVWLAWARAEAEPAAEPVVLPTSLYTESNWSDPRGRSSSMRWDAVESARQAFRPAGTRAVVRGRKEGGFELVEGGRTPAATRLYLTGVVGLYGGLLLYLLLGRWLWRRNRGVFRRCAEASRTWWEARR